MPATLTAGLSVGHVGSLCVMPHRPILITMVFAVVAFSIVVQRLILKPLLKRLGLLEAAEMQGGKDREPVLVGSD